jgi:hypothetical protein|nr:MAG TPA: hypothetical protein [Caudoviricetes sp.]
MKNAIVKIIMFVLGKVVYWPLYVYSVLMCRYFGSSLNSVLEDNSRYKAEHVRIGNKLITRLTDKWGRTKYVFANMDENPSKVFKGAKYALLLTYNEFSEKVESEVIVYHINLGILRYSGRQRESFLTSLEQLESLF